MFILERFPKFSPEITVLILFLLALVVLILVYVCYIAPKKYITRLIALCGVLFLSIDRWFHNDSFLFFTGLAIFFGALISLLIPKEKKAAGGAENG